MRKIFHPVLMILIAGAAVLSLAVAGQAQTTAPAASTVAQTPAATAPEKTQPRRSPRRPQALPATVTVVADQARVAPQVVTIVHRLSGVKMLRFLMRLSGAPNTVYTIDPQ